MGAAATHRHADKTLLLPMSTPSDNGYFCRVNGGERMLVIASRHSSRPRCGVRWVGRRRRNTAAPSWAQPTKKDRAAQHALGTMRETKLDDIGAPEGPRDSAACDDPDEPDRVGQVRA